ncbi:MAG: hypothetical protein L0Y58_17045 [Verrucomicrobia subdivision 3 bacterium]|nr:hypothetical protein [Limisphaerales bacterium]
MNADEAEIYEFLRGFPGVFVSVTEISKKLGNRRRIEVDRNWARPILRRMEMDGALESNPFGEYRLRQKEVSEINFKDALSNPSVPLGDTTIIKIQDVKGADTV